MDVEMTDLQTDIEYLEQQFLDAGQSKSHEMRAVLEAARLYQNLIGQGLRQEQSVSSQRWITDWAVHTPPGDTGRATT